MTGRLRRTPRLSPISRVAPNQAFKTRSSRSPRGAPGMRYYLLTGAGFSANWGGWVASEAFEYLLGCPEILADDRLRDLLWDYQLKGGFEDALAELQTGHSAGFAQQWS